MGYLRGFTAKGERSLIWEYDKIHGLVSEYPRSIRQICSRHKYYAQKDENGKDEHVKLENAFQKVEDRFPRILKSIQPKRPGEKVVLSARDFGTLSCFVALQLMRVPNYRDGIESLYRGIAEESLKLHLEHGYDDNTLPPVIRKIYKDENLFSHINIAINPAVSLPHMIEGTRIGARALLRKHWTFVLPADDGYFVTSDNPVHSHLSEDLERSDSFRMEPFHPRSEVTMPLRRDLALICTPFESSSFRGPGIWQFNTLQLSGADTKALNRRTAIAAKRFVYASLRSEALARMVRERGHEKGHPLA